MSQEEILSTSQNDFASPLAASLSLCEKRRRRDGSLPLYRSNQQQVLPKNRGKGNSLTGFQNLVSMIRMLDQDMKDLGSSPYSAINLPR